MRFDQKVYTLNDLSIPYMLNQNNQFYFEYYPTFSDKQYKSQVEIMSNNFCKEDITGRAKFYLWLKQAQLNKFLGKTNSALKCSEEIDMIISTLTEKRIRLKNLWFNL